MRPGEVRDLLDVAVLTVYFVLFIFFSEVPRDDFLRLVIAATLAVAALVLMGFQASAEDAADARSAG